MSRNVKRYDVRLTEGELLLAIEAVGAYKPVIRSKAARMAAKRGINHLGRSHQRLSKIITLQMKLTEAGGHKHVEMPQGYKKRKRIRKSEWQNKNNQSTD